MFEKAFINRFTTIRLLKVTGYLTGEGYKNAEYKKIKSLNLEMA